MNFSTSLLLRQNGGRVWRFSRRGCWQCLCSFSSPRTAAETAAAASNTHSKVRAFRPDPTFANPANVGHPKMQAYRTFADLRPSRTCGPPAHPKMQAYRTFRIYDHPDMRATRPSSILQFELSRRYPRVPLLHVVAQSTKLGTPTARTSRPRAQSPRTILVLVGPVS